QTVDPAGLLIPTADGKRFVTAVGDWLDATQPASLRFWDVAVGRPLIALGASNQVTHAAFVPGTDLLLGGDASGSVIAWNGTHPTDISPSNSASNSLSTQLLSSFLRRSRPPPLSASELTIAARLPDGPSSEEVLHKVIPPRDRLCPSNLLDLGPHASAA